MLKPGGLLSILPVHLTEAEWTQILAEVKGAGFSLNTILEGRGLHFDLHLVNSEKQESMDALERGTASNFSKC